MPFPTFRPAAAAIAACIALAACTTAPNSSTPVARVVPPTNCKAWVGTDRNAELPGYTLRQADGTSRCVPLLLTAAHAPAGYAGDFHVQEFTLSLIHI